MFFCPVSLSSCVFIFLCFYLPVFLASCISIFLYFYLYCLFGAFEYALTPDSFLGALTCSARGFFLVLQRLSAFHTLPYSCLWVLKRPFGFSYPPRAVVSGYHCTFRLFIPSRAVVSGYYSAFSAFHTLPRSFFWVLRCLFGFPYPPVRLSLGITAPFRLFIPSRTAVSGYYGAFSAFHTLPCGFFLVLQRLSAFHTLPYSCLWVLKRPFGFSYPPRAASSGYHGALSAFHTLPRICLWVSRCLFGFSYPPPRLSLGITVPFRLSIPSRIFPTKQRKSSHKPLTGPVAALLLEICFFYRFSDHLHLVAKVQ